MKPHHIIAFSAALLPLFLSSCGEKTTPSGSIAQKDCPVSGEPLGSMGEPVVVDHEGFPVKLCCESCIEKFQADPASYVARVKAASGQ